MMDSDKTYADSLKYINNLLRLNCGGEVIIDYNKLDHESQGYIRKALDNALMARRNAVEGIVMGPSKY